MGLVENLLTKLQNDSVVGGATGWTGYISKLPDSPDQAIAIFEVGGEFPTPNEEMPLISIQIRAGEDDYASARSKADDVINSLDGLSEDDFSSVVYLYISSSVNAERHDDNSRPVLSLTFEGMVKR